LDFSDALEALKDGYKVAREGWNGKGMFIYLVKGQTVEPRELRNEADEHVGSELPHDTEIKINSHIDMKAADGSIVVGWSPSQTDLLAEDWQLVD
jgi:hypothetical protein